jgi:hypothetical protein
MSSQLFDVLVRTALGGTIMLHGTHVQFALEHGSSYVIDYTASAELRALCVLETSGGS